MQPVSREDMLLASCFRTVKIEPVEMLVGSQKISRVSGSDVNRSCISYSFVI